jgi:hypothetical protein
MAGAGSEESLVSEDPAPRRTKIVALGNSDRRAMDPKNPDAKDTHSTVSTRHAFVAQMARIPARVTAFWKIDTAALWPNFRIDWK